MEGNPPPTDYAATLADMEAKYAVLGNAIASLRAALASGALGVAFSDSIQFQDSVNIKLSPAAPHVGQGGVSLPRGAFLGKKAPEAIKLYLSAVRKKQTNKEIAQALKDGGLESTGNFDSYITSGLFRLKNDGAVLRFDDGWGLAEWYPESFRNRVADKTATNGRNGKKKKKKAVRKSRNPKSATVAPKMPNSEPGSQPKQKPQMQIEEYFVAHAGKNLSSKEIATGLNLRSQTVSLICAKLAHVGKIEMTTDGRFRLPKVQKAP